MRPITNEDIKILGRLVNISTEGVVADASQVYDSTQRKNQEVINSEMKNKTKNATTTTYGIVRLASGKNDADNTDVPTIKILRDAIQDAIDGILEDPNHTLQDQLNSIRELANAINNDASFYTTIQNWLAQKADKSAFDILKGRVDDLAERVAYLEECCEQVHQYMDEFSITWSGAGSSHVRISPAVLRAGTNTAVCTIDNGWHCNTPLTRSNVLGDYDTITQTGTDTNIQLVFTGVRSNIVINAPITKTFFNITKYVGGMDSTDTYPFEVVYSGTHANAQTIAAGTALNLTVTGKTDRDVFDENVPVSITIGDQGYRYSWLDHPYTTIDWLNGEPHSITIQIPASDINGDIELFFNGWHESSARLFVQISPNPNVDGTPGWQMGRPQYYYGSGSNPGYRDAYDGYSESVKGYFVNSITGDLLNPDMWPISATSALQTKLNNNDTSVYRLKSSTGYEGRTGSGIFTVSDGPNKTAITNILNVLFFTGGSRSGNLHMVGPNNINDDTDYTVTIETETIPLYTISYVGMTGRFYSTNTATSVVENASFSTNFIHEAGVMPGIYMTVTKVMMGGVDITTQAKAGSHDVDIDHVTGNVVITVQENQDFFEFDGEVTINVSHGSANPDTLWSDGTSQTSTITPNSGYTLTGATVSSDNNEVTASLNGSTLTISGQSNNNTTITVTLPAEGTPTPSGPAQVNVVLSNPNAGTANPASGTATSGNFSSNISFNYSAGYDANDSYLVVKDNDGNIIADGVSGYGVSYTYSSNSPTYSSISLTGLQDNKVYTATVYVVSPLGDVIFDAYGRTNDYGDTHRKGVLNYGGSAYGSSAGDYSTADPHTAGYAYGEIVLPDISTFNVSGSTNEEKVRNLVNNTTFQLSKIDNNGVISGSVFVLSADSNTPFSFTNGASVTGNTYISNTNNINIRLNGTTPIIDIVCDRFVNDTPSTDTYTITDGHPVVDSDPIFRDYNYGTHTTIEEATSGSRQYINDSTWTDVLTMYSNTNGVLLYSRIFRYGYAIREISTVVATSGNGSVQYQAYAFPLSAIDHYEYVITDGSNNTIDSGNITVQDDVNNAVLPNSVNTTTYPVHTVTVTAVPKSTASASSVGSTMTYDYSS